MIFAGQSVRMCMYLLLRAFLEPSARVSLCVICARIQCYHHVHCVWIPIYDVLSTNANMYTPLQTYFYQFITDIKRTSIHIQIYVGTAHQLNPYLRSHACMSPWKFIHSSTYGNQWKVLATCPKPRFAILTAQGAATCRSEVGV